MPWSKKQGGGECAAAEWAVIKDDDGSTAGCHATEEEADAQIAALMADEGTQSFDAYAISQADGQWLVMRGTRVLAIRSTPGKAVEALAEVIVDEVVMPSTGGFLLPERWAGPVSRSKLTTDKRDFTAVQWSWRDPKVSAIPLMWQTVTDVAHFSAQLAGYVEEFWMDGDTPWASGSFFDNEPGRQFRDTLAAVGRWGVSVDASDAEVEETCTARDEMGFCIDGTTQFLSYQISGVTGTPFPAMDDAYISLVTADEPAAPVPAIAAGVGPVRPPVEWFRAPQFAELCPLTIEETGQVYGHAAGFGQCHVGWPGTCVTAPRDIALSFFRTGEVLCGDGSRVPTGPLFMGTGHPALDVAFGAQGAVDHYSHTGTAWADVSVGTDEFGIWVAGAVRPTIDEEQIRCLRASGLSGDWREVNGKLSLVAILSVNTPGFPIPRALAASGKPHPQDVPTRLRMAGDNLVAAVGIGRVTNPCPECEKRRASETAQRVAAAPDQFEALTASVSALAALIESIGADVRAIDRRTRAIGLSDDRRAKLTASFQRIG